MSLQRNLPGIARADHSNLGGAFEAELKATHDFYRARRLADVVKNPHEYVFISERQYRELLAAIRDKREPRGIVAVTDDGKFLRRVPSDVDFSGGGATFSITFDAKETAQNRFPLSMLKRHQTARLVASRRCGAIAGYMIKMEAFGRVFFLPAMEADRLSIELLKASYGKRRAPAGSASLSLPDLEKRAVEISKRPENGLWDWLPALVEKSS